MSLDRIGAALEGVDGTTAFVQHQSTQGRQAILAVGFEQGSTQLISQLRQHHRDSRRCSVEGIRCG